MNLEALERAIKSAGGQSALARFLGTTQGNIWGWLNNSKSIPPKWVLKIEELTGVSRHELRPDIYPLEDRGSRDTQ